MAVKDVFRVELYPDPKSGSGMSGNPYYPGEDITSGILNVEIVEGADIYEGPYQQIDTGQFTIVSRNPALDPKVNPNLKYNSRIAFIDERYGEFFRGYVTNVDVQYQRNDDPIITITGTDIFGVLQRIVVDELLYNNIIALSDGPTWQGATFEEFCTQGGGSLGDFVNNYLETDVIGATYTPPVGFAFYVDSSTFLWTTISPAANELGYSPARYIPELGETLLDVINKYATTNFNKIYSKGEFGYNIINIFPFVKYNGAYWKNNTDPYTTYTTYDFSSDPADDAPYRTILVDNGYNRVINQIDISNQYQFLSDGEVQSQLDNLGPYISTESAQNFAVTKASVSTFFPDNYPATLEDMGADFAQSVFQLVGTPSDEIQKITFDNARYQDIQDEVTYSFAVVNQMVRIKHQVSPTETIDKIYEIAGITHSITPDDWEMGFSFKPSDAVIAYNYAGDLPTLQMNALSGDANFNFTATITDYDPEQISSILWDLNQRDPNEMTSNTYYSATTGEKFKNGLPRTGFTQTWNFDDDGILAPYSFNPDRSFDFTGETDNRNGGYGPGNWWVTAYITLTNGFTIAIQQGIVVGTPEVTANFGWSQNLTNNFGQVTFTDTSTNHETGEPDSYLWDFGDGTTSNLQNPVKTYDPSPSTTQYTVSLTVFAYGGDPLTPTKIYNTKTETITLVQPTMVPDFTFTTSNSTVTFLNTSTNVGFEEPDAYLWNFGDGTTSTEKNPVKTYSGFEGQTLSYNVSLTTRNIWEQTASVTKTVSFTITFTVGNYGVTWIRLRPFNPTNYTSGTRFTPYIFSFKGLASQTNANLLFGKSAQLSGTAGQTWTNTAGGNVLVTGGFSGDTNTGNLTGTGGLSGFANSGYTSSGLPWQMQINWFNTDTPKFNLKDFALTLRDVTVGSTAQWQTVYIDIYTNLGWTEVGFFAIGKGPVGKNILGASAGITEEERKVTLTRVLPINNLGFNYTFSNNSYTANFTAGISGTSYLWQFGDGTTSTLQNPSKTFSSRGIKYVTLNATTGGVTTSITEPVNVLPIFSYNPRYIRIKQKLHDGTHQWDTPYIANLKLQTVSGSYVSGGALTNPQSIVSKRITAGTAWSPSYTGATTFDPLNTQNLTNNTGLRFSTTNVGNTSEWDVVVDYKEAVSTRIHNITLDAAIPTVSGFAPTTATGISYEIFTTPYIGTFASATDPDNIGGGATWTKIGEINPTTMLQDKLTTYNLIPS